MASYGDYFPYQQLTHDQAGLISDLFRGQRRSVSTMADFLEGCGDPMIEKTMVKPLLYMAAKACEGSVDLPSYVSQIAYVNGGRFYAAVLSETSPHTTIPYDPECLDRFNIGDENFPAVAKEKIISEAGVFGGFMFAVKDALEMPDSDMFELGMIGAGLVHMITTTSLQISCDGAMLEAHPELQDVIDNTHRV